ncbi:MAG: hypothetical protein RMJ43_03545 [Chloroherpetonaceae bacterium]|nr:hypothetical protein [Chthonomonadaceae bacterium]MDW8206886.1 hypothetical protein [Chloroherpetonaceae bacterium]
MHDFKPEPDYSSEEWRQISIRYREQYGSARCPNCAYEAFIPPFTEATWIAWGYFDDDSDSEDRLFPFATSTDCLLWLRWAVFEAVLDREDCLEDDPTIRDTARLAICQIDTAEPGASSEQLLEALDYAVRYEQYGKFILSKVESLADYVVDNGSLEEWSAFLDVEADFEKSWQNSLETWQKLYDAFKDAGFTRIHPPELPEE